MSKPNTYMQGNHFRPPRSPDVEAAKHIISVARRYVNDRASRREMDEAISFWRDATAAAPDESGSSEALAREARASVVLDGETHCVEDPSVQAQVDVANRVLTSTQKCLDDLSKQTGVTLIQEPRCPKCSGPTTIVDMPRPRKGGGIFHSCLNSSCGGGIWTGTLPDTPSV